MEAYRRIGIKLDDPVEAYSKGWDTTAAYWKGWIRVHSPALFDLVIMNWEGDAADHVGIMLKNNRVMHSIIGDRAVTTHVNKIRGKILGYYRLDD